MSDERPREPAEDGLQGADQPGTPEAPRLRKRPFGYKRTDVDDALAIRDSQVAELRQDIAALWLAFAQHDRMIRELGVAPESAVAAPTTETAPHEDPATAGADSTAAVEGAEAIGQQLSDLDEVLAAIEMATQTLERSYADEIAVPEGDGEQAKEDASEADEPPR